MWLIVFLAIGIGLTSLFFWLRSNDIKVSWYEWVIGIVGLLLILFTIQNYFGTQAEYEDAAANTFLLVTGLPGLILMALAWQLAWRRKRISS